MVVTKYPVLGPVETEVLGMIFGIGQSATIREVHNQFGGDKHYSSIKTTMDNLVTKGYLTKVKSDDSKSFIYSTVGNMLTLIEKVVRTYADLMSADVTKISQGECLFGWGIIEPGVLVSKDA